MNATQRGWMQQKIDGGGMGRAVGEVLVDLDKRVQSLEFEVTNANIRHQQAKNEARAKARA